MDPENKQQSLKGCLEWTLSLMKFAGYWFPRSGNTSKVALYTLYSTVVMSCTLITLTCTEAAYLVAVFGQVGEMVDTLFVLLTHAMQCIKVTTFIWQKETIYKLLDCIEEDAFQPKNSRQWESAIKITTYTNKLAKLLVGLVVACCLFCGLCAVAEATSGTRQLPTKALYPFGTDMSPRYEIMATYLTISCTIVGCANAAMDMVAAAFISHICIQLDLVGDTLAHIKDFAELQLAKKSSLSTDFKSEGIVSVELEHEMRTVLVDCIEHHLKLKQFAENVERVFGLSLFVQFLTAVCTIGMTLLEITVVPKLSPYFGLLVIYQSCMLTEIALFCWYGNETIYKSKKLPVSLYNSEWVNCSVSYKKMIIFTMANMQKELTIRVGGLVTFSLETLLTVLQTAWSYFLVLDQVRQDS